MTLTQKIDRTFTKVLAKDDTFTNALYSRSESLANFLPYDEYLPDWKLFLNKDGSLGVIYEVTLLEHEAMTSDSILSAVANLKNWFSLPERCTLQILYDQSDLRSTDPVFKNLESSYENAHSVSKMLFEKRLEMLKDTCDKQTDTAPFKRNLTLSIRYFPKYLKNAKLNIDFKNANKTLFREMTGFVSELKEFQGLLLSFEHNSKIALKRLDADQFLNQTRTFFNPVSSTKRTFAAFNPNVALSKQILYNTPLLDHASFNREGFATRTLSLKTSPQWAYPGGMAYFTKLNFPFKLSLSFSFPPKDKIKRFFDVKEFFLQNTPSAKSRRQRDEILAVQERLAREDQCLHMTFSVILDALTDDELDAREREVINLFQNELGCDVIQERDIGLGLCLNSLPLNYSPKSDASAQRYIRILRSDATKFVPIFDSFRGLEKPLQLYQSRERNLVKFSLLENETSNHTVVLADTGSGKSAFVIDCIQAAKRLDPEPLVFVIDKKSSYLMLSKYFDADLTVFDWDQDMPFSPFRGAYDDAKFSFLTGLITTAIRMTSENFSLESDHEAAITKALKNAYSKKCQTAGLLYESGQLISSDSKDQVSLSMDDVIESLSALTADPDFESFSAQIETITAKLKSFYGDGQYAKFFKGGKNSATSSKLFRIYDLDALDKNPVMQALMTMAVIEEIRQTIKLPENRARGGFVVIEELGMIGGENPAAARFIKDAAETFRKLGFWLISLTPRPQNYFEIEAGKAMWSVADNFIFLQMSEDNVRYVKEKSSLLDEASSEIISSLRTVRNQYAEVFYMNKKKTKQGAFRFSQTPYDRWLSPTNAKDMNTVSEVLDQCGGDKWKALDKLVTSHN